MENNYPLWVEKVGRSGGRDHLSLESVGQAILEEITTGISNITKRARYYSFYCWVIKSFFDSDTKKTRKNYRKYMRRASFLYTMSNSSKHLDASLTGIDGIEFARNNLDKLISKQKIADEDFFQSHKYLDNNWIYKAKLNDLLLTTDNDMSGIPALVEPYGKKLAEAFEKSLGDTQVDLENFGNWEIEYLNKLEDIWCYHNLSKHKKERQILEDAFFARNEDNSKQLNRRYSLTLILHYIEQFGNKNLHDFEKWVCSKPNNLPEKMKQIANVWSYLFSRNYLVFSFESLFLYFILTISRQRMSLEQFYLILKENIANQDQNKTTITTNYLDKQVSQLIKKLGDDVKNQTLYETNMIVQLDLLNRNEYQNNKIEFLTKPILVLFALYNRYKKNNYSAQEEIFLGIGDAQRISILSWIKIVDDALKNNLTLFEFITNIIQSHIITRHQLVATQKFYSQNLDTFHFRIDENLFDVKAIANEFRPKYNVMKIDEIYNIFEDLDLVVYGEEKYVLTKRGKEVLKEFYE